MSVVLLSVLACQPEPGENEIGTVPEEPTSSDTLPSEPTVPAEPAALTALGARLHDELQTLVYVRWTQSAAASVHVEFSVDAGEWRSSPVRELVAGAHEELLLGVPYDTPVTWRVVAENAAGATTSPDREDTTGPRPPSLPRADVSVADAGRWDPDTGYVFVSITALDGDGGDPWWSMIVDRKGRAVWARLSPAERTSKHTRLSADGTALLIDHNSYWATFDSSDGEVVKMRIDGSIVHTYPTPGLHHPFVELPDQSIAYGAFVDRYEEELQIAHLDGTHTSLWDCSSWLASIGEAEDCASNTLTYDPQTDRFLFSFFTFETILEIDRTTGEVGRRFGHLDGSYSFAPPGSAFWWQHGGIVTPTGTLLVSSDLSPDGDETIVREYHIDDDAQTLEEVWSFGIGDGIYGEVRGEAHRLGNGNTLHNTGRVPRLREADPGGEVVWDLTWEDGEIGRSAPVGDLWVLAPDRP